MSATFFKEKLTEVLEEIINIPDDRFVENLRNARRKKDCSKCINFKFYQYGVPNTFGEGPRRRDFWTALLQKIIQILQTQYEKEVEVGMKEYCRPVSGNPNRDPRFQ